MRQSRDDPMAPDAAFGAAAKARLDDVTAVREGRSPSFTHPDWVFGSHCDQPRALHAVDELMMTVRTNDLHLLISPSSRLACCAS